MGLIRLGDYIEQTDTRNVELKFDESFVKGISTYKTFIATKADLNGVSLKNYKIINPGEFAYVADTSRRGDKIALAFCKLEPIIVSSIYTSFRVKDYNKLDPLFLLMFFNRAEFDRYARFNSWGSARETFDWEDMCNITLNLPPIEIQRKFVSVYEGLSKNLKVYESKLDDFKTIFEGYIQNIKKQYPLEAIGGHIEKNKNKNTQLDCKILGISNEGFIYPRQKTGDESSYTCFSFNDFVYNHSRINIGSIGLYKRKDKCACSPIYVAFHVSNTNVLNPDYLLIWFKRPDFLRYAEYHSIASVRNNFSFDLMKEYKIPIPPLEIQNCIVDIFDVYNKRKEIASNLKDLIKKICPLLIAGAVSENRKNESSFNEN